MVLQRAGKIFRSIVAHDCIFAPWCGCSNCHSVVNGDSQEIWVIAISKIYYSRTLGNLVDGYVFKCYIGSPSLSLRASQKSAFWLRLVGGFLLRGGTCWKFPLLMSLGFLWGEYHLSCSSSLWIRKSSILTSCGSSGFQSVCAPFDPLTH